MVRIADPVLSVEPVAGHPGERRLVVTYTIEVPPGDPVIGGAIVEEATVRPLDVHDAPTAPMPLEVQMEHRMRVERAESLQRRLASDVHRIDLDVEQDWWDTDQAGGFQPIAEFLDHLVAEVCLRVDDTVIATAETPVVTGSWGALGKD